MTEPPDSPDYSRSRLVGMFTSCIDAEVKSEIISSLTSTTAPLRVVCERLLGMGIDCPYVRQVMHLGVPEDNESYNTGEWPCMRVTHANNSMIKY